MKYCHITVYTLHSGSNVPGEERATGPNITRDEKWERKHLGVQNAE